MVEAVRKKILTVGDGDLSLSLALSRAYGDHIDVTASVLESDRCEFLRVFPEAPLDELHRRGVSVLYGVDATQLHKLLKDEAKNNLPIEEEATTKVWDLVSFHHPHLGVSNLENWDESARAALHHRLLCHYLHSAKQLSKLVHVCLTGTQPKTWNLSEAAKRQNLTLAKTLPDSKPFCNLWMEDTAEDKKDGHQSLPKAATAEPHFAAPRKYRNGKLGRHSLARYGYRHRRTEGVLFRGSSKDANVSESMHFVFAETNKCLSDVQNDNTYKEIGSETTTDNNVKEYFVCPICNESFNTESALDLHLTSPISLPTIPEMVRARIVPNGEEDDPLKTEPNLDTKYHLACEPSGETVLEQHCHERLGTILTVPSTSQGKRLRWFLQHSKIDKFKFTKRLAESTIQTGLVSVNGQVALDSSRILQGRDTVTIQKPKQGGTEGGNNTKEMASSRTPKVEIIKRSLWTSSLTWLVALKPSGTRTKGNFQGTLEYIVSEQEQKQYSCISSLETSCSGLCVLVQTTIGGSKCVPNHGSSLFNSGKARISVLHTLTVLVHGRLVRDEWFLFRKVSLVLEGKWRQKKKNKKRKHALESLSKAQQEEEFRDKAKNVVPARIEFKESFAISETNSPSHDNNTGLSTLEVATAEPSSGSICHYFRQVGFPVVGDTFCKQEYSKLKRSIRNRIKNKLCMGCFRVDVSITEETDGAEEASTTTHRIEIPSPNKLSATFWEKFLCDEAPPALKTV